MSASDEIKATKGRMGRYAGKGRTTEPDCDHREYYTGQFTCTPSDHAMLALAQSNVELVAALVALTKALNRKHPEGGR